MSGIQANWGIGDTTLSNSSAAAVRQIRQLQSNGTVIDLTESPDEIQGELARLTAKEGRFEANGLSCDLKWEQGHRLMGGTSLSCFECPNFTEDPEDPRTVVCRVGRRQESLVDQLQAAVAVETLDEAYIEAVERDIEHCEALAEAVAT